MPLGVSRYCHIKNNQVYLDGELRFEDASAKGLKAFAAKAFRAFQVRYPKYYKMDDISKLGFLAAELLLQAVNRDFQGKEVGIVLANAHATLVTDSRFQESISDYDHFYPSPAVFVYTLPNIMIGEISIRHKLMGENAFFIFDRFKAGPLTAYINKLHAGGKIARCIGGWVDQSPEDYEAFLYWAEPFDHKTVAVKHTEKEINRLYNIIDIGNG